MQYAVRQAVADDDSSGLLFLLFLYLIFNGFMLINGLLGIFGQVFTTQDEQVSCEFAVSNVRGMFTEFVFLSYLFVLSISTYDNHYLDNRKPLCYLPHLKYQ